MTTKKNRLPVFAAILFATSFAFLPAVASATILTFDQGTVANFDNVDQAYGDDVEATTEGMFGYGVGTEGFTPDVQISYGDSDPTLWTTGYGDLVNVLYEATGSTGVLTVTLTADPGFLVQLYEFDAAGWPNTDYTIDAVRVSDGGSDLFLQTDVFISGATSTPFDFTASPLTAPQLILEIDARNLGASSDNIGIDNIRFGQVAIPEPSTFALALLSLLGMGNRRRKRA